MSPEAFELCQPRQQEEFERIIVEVNGERRRATWRSPAMRVITKDEGQELAVSDSPWLGSHALIFRQSAIATLGEMLTRHGELLSLDCADDASLSILNVTTVLDALDEDASTVLRFSDGRIMMVRNYIFRPHVIGDADIFKIPNLRMSPTFVSRRFVDAWESHHLRGLEFKRLWSAD
jgi:hypothetical protein